MSSKIKQLKKKQLELEKLEKLLGVDSSEIAVQKNLYAKDLENRAQELGLSVAEVLEADSQLLSQPGVSKECLKPDAILLFIEDKSQISVGSNEHLNSCSYCQQMVQLTKVDHQAKQHILDQLVSPPPLGGGDIRKPSWVSSTLDSIEKFGEQRQGLLTGLALALTMFLCVVYSQPFAERPDQIASEDQENSTLLEADYLDKISNQLESLTHTHAVLSHNSDATYAVARDKISSSSERMIACAENWSAPHLADFNMSKLNYRIETDPENANVWIYLLVRGKLHLQSGNTELAQSDFQAARAKLPETDNTQFSDFLMRAKEVPLSDFNNFWCKNEIEMYKPLIASVKTMGSMEEEPTGSDK